MPKRPRNPLNPNDPFDLLAWPDPDMPRVLDISDDHGSRFNSGSPAAWVAAARGDIANTIAASTKGGIERQERQGQSDFVESMDLPKEVTGATREQLVSIGFQFFKDSDDIFVNAKLPVGWKKVATDHAMWSRLLDEQGRERASIFYKAAFYDRRASMDMKRRFHVESHEKGEAPNTRKVVIKDGVTNMDRLIAEYPEDDYKASDSLREKAKAWLQANYPDYESALAYWGAMTMEESA